MSPKPPGHGGGTGSTVPGGFGNKGGEIDRAVPPLCGIVLAGGRSSRMGSDKALLRVRGRPVPQHLFLYNELEAVCGCAYLSGRGRPGEERWTALPAIHDSYPEIGPMAGVLTAMQSLPNYAWLVVAVDLVNVTRHELALLCAARTPERAATAAYNPSIRAPEPLFAIYEPHAFAELRKRFDAGRYSLRQALEELGASLVTTLPQSAMENANNPEDL